MEEEIKQIILYIQKDLISIVNVNQDSITFPTSNLTEDENILLNKLVLKLEKYK